MRIGGPILAQAILAATCAAACSSSEERASAADTGAPLDAGARPDSARITTPTDAEALPDAGDPPPRPGDAALLADSGVDATTPADAGVAPAGCGAEDARAATCPAALCDGPSSWHWNGDSCFEIDCGACEGADCARRTLSQAECLAAHARCEPARCRATGGTWRWWAQECGHLVCGRSVPADCEVGFPVCDCGPLRRFDPSSGCVEDPACPPPEPEPRDRLCAATGGTWTPSICCDTVCGQPCAAACDADACACGPGRIFDDVRGCIDGARCHERLPGETCGGDARCAQGTLCCGRCGGAGCFGEPTCIAPVCDDDPAFDECGNCTLCP